MNSTADSKLLLKEESFVLQGAIFEVYRELGCGFIEAVYQEALAREFSIRNIPFMSQSEMTIEYKGFILSQVYRPDFVCYEKIILELKAVKETNDEHKAQLHNYLKVSKLHLGLLINFGHYPRATVERIVL
ncbi:MAG: GxxExxY protein [Chloroflexi bacterium HGW-Chloroflexi-5]|jgi:GxxExxY protein|nr:MAG: GxxExxY protein [Chloroflexi bacterium HGW-Chloroflexi-5]